MSQLPTPPSSREISTEPNGIASHDLSVSPTLNSKIDLLDDLLERYLHLLDIHQKLYQSLGKQLSSGFFQLAHANYVSPGRRFGEDFYDERMKATRKLEVMSSTARPPNHREGKDNKTSNNLEMENVKFKVVYKSTLKMDDHDDDDDDREKDASDEKSGTAIAENVEDSNSKDPNRPENTSRSTVLSQSSTNSSNSTEEKAPQQEDVLLPETKEAEIPIKTKRKTFRTDDPISWYGILVPPSLRQAQASFTEVIENEILNIAGVVKEMQYLESLIHDLREQINPVAGAETLPVR